MDNKKKVDDTTKVKNTVDKKKKPDSTKLESKKTNTTKLNNKKKDNKNKFDLIITVINQGFSDYVIDTARNSGASGATILYARGATHEEEQKFWGINVRSEKEIVLILVPKEEKVRIMKEIAKQTQIEETGKGLCFSVPVNDVAGIKHLLKKKPKKESKKDII